MNKKPRQQERTMTLLIIIATIVINVTIALLFLIPKQDRDIPFDVTILPRLNAIFNSFTFIFLLAALYFILKKNINKIGRASCRERMKKLMMTVTGREKDKA